MRIFSAFVIGLVFGLGIVLSGMANPAKVLNFFDVLGHWDASLAFVMGGALVTTLIGYRVVLRRARPLSASHFRLRTRTDIDLRLVWGAAIFGVGWGIAGFCPGGALPAIGTGRADVLVFVAALVTGIVATRAVLDWRASGAAAPSAR